MKKTCSRLLALLLTLLAPLCACSAAKPPSPIPEDGWYQETALALPKGIGTVLDLCSRADGSLALLANTDRNSPYGPWKLWQSTDGEGWAEQPLPWLQQQDGQFALVTARLLSEGGLLLCSLAHYEQLENGDEMEVTYCLTQLSPQGEATWEQSFSRRSQHPVASMQLTQDGDLLIEEGGKLTLLDAGTFEEKRQFGAGEADIDGYSCRGDTLYLTAADAVQSYSLSTGEIEGSFDTLETVRSFYAFGAMSSRASGRLLLPDANRETLYYCDQNGIFAHADGGRLVEQIVEGPGSSLSLPTRKPLALCALPEGFAILFEEGEGYHLSRFQYTEGARPHKGELTVYTISNFRDGRLRQAIGFYELDSGMRVNYQVGQPVDSEGRLTVSLSDAMRTLSTELMAGNGPDVLVFNGMPPRSMVEKGVLLDLGPLAGPHLETGEWLPGIADGFRQADGSLYGIPMSFSLPAVFADHETLQKVQDFDSFTGWAERLAAENPGLRPCEVLSTDYLFSFFYPLCHNAWEGPGNPEEPISRFLDNIQRLQALDVPDIPILNDLDIAAWHEGRTALAMGTLSSVSHLAQMASLLSSSGREGKLQLMGGFGEACFLPGSILSVNANGQCAQAQRFIETVLDSRCQTYEYFDGMPVNRTVLERQLSETDVQHQEFGYVIEGLDNIRLYVDNAWPDAAFASRFWEMVSGAKHPAQVDAEETEAFFEAFFPCFDSGAPISGRLAGYLERLQLKGAE